MCIGSSVPTGFSHQTDSIGFSYPFFHANFKAIQPCTLANYGEFAIIKIRVIDFLLNT